MLSHQIHQKLIEVPGEIANSQRYQSLSSFSTVYGVGSVTARKLYDLGLRTLDDLRVYYDVDEDEEQEALALQRDITEEGEIHSVTSAVRKIEADESNGIKIGLMIHRDLSVRSVSIFSFRIYIIIFRFKESQGPKAKKLLELSMMNYVKLKLAVLTLL